MHGQSAMDFWFSHQHRNGQSKNIINLRQNLKKNLFKLSKGLKYLLDTETGQSVM